MRSKKILMIGPYPGPHGGVSLHIKRLRELLKESNIHPIVYDTNGFGQKAGDVVSIDSFPKWFMRFLLSNTGEAIVHFHASGLNWKQITKLSLIGIFKKKLITTFHSLRDELRDINCYESLGIKILSRSDSFFIAVNCDIKEKLLALGVKPGNVDVIPAFIPPTLKEEDIHRIPYSIWEFIETHKPLISGNATDITFYNNQDLYGIDLSIDLCANLTRDYPHLGFIFKISTINDFAYFNQLKEMVIQKGLKGTFLLVTQDHEFYPILMKSDIFVRPTNTDGDAVSVREALYFKVPVVASDSAPRPEATILFKNRDINDFTLKVASVLRKYKEHKKKVEAFGVDDYFKKIVQVYRKLGLQAQ